MLRRNSPCGSLPRRAERRREMNDLYSQLVSMPVAGTGAKRIGLPQPVELERGASEITGRVLLGGAGRGAQAAPRGLARQGARPAPAPAHPLREPAPPPRPDPP